MLEVVKYIKSHPNWREELSNSPYNLKIIQEGRYIHLKYDQIESDFKEKIVQECRGLILEDETFRILACPFFKFFNYGESNAHEIDWDSATYEEKFDGSLIKVWHDDVEDKWIISSNGRIFAKSATVNNFLGQVYTNFEDLFLDSIKVDVNNFVKGYTYVFELISPYNQVVVRYDDCEVIHLMTRDNSTLKEVEMDLGVRKPIKYSARCVEDLIEVTNRMTSQEEGFIVVDKNYNRIKVKSPEYVKAHHLVTSLTKMNLLRVIRSGEVEEVRTYLKGREEFIDEMYNDFENFKRNLELLKSQFLDLMTRCETKKDYAMAIKDNLDKYFGFELYKNPDLSVKDYINSLRDEILLKNIERGVDLYE